MSRRDASNLRYDLMYVRSQSQESMYVRTPAKFKYLERKRVFQTFLQTLVYLLIEAIQMLKKRRYLFRDRN